MKKFTYKKAQSLQLNDSFSYSGMYWTVIDVSNIDGMSKIKATNYRYGVRLLSLVGITNVKLRNNI